MGNADDLPEEAAPLADESGTLPGDAEVLAGEATDEKVNIGASFCQFRSAGIRGLPYTLPSMFSCHASHIGPSSDAGPSLGEDAGAEEIELDLEGALMACSLKPLVKAADAREE